MSNVIELAGDDATTEAALMSLAKAERATNSDL